VTSLPTLRRKILRSFLSVVALYAFLGLLLVASVFIASGTTPRLLHLNYDSISDADQMRESWNALGNPSKYSSKNDTQWIDRFEQGLIQEEANITEPGEKEIAQAIRAIWNQNKNQVSSLDSPKFQEMNALLNRLVTVNEQGMFGLAQSNEALNRQVLIGTVVYLFITLILVIFVAQQLAHRLTQPLKNIAEILHSRPSVSKRLKLPDPTTLELFILTTELTRLWERISDSEKVNVDELVKEKHKLETVLESVEDALLFIGPTGVVSHCNDRLASLVGLTQNQIQGCIWTDLPTLHDNYMKLRDVLRNEMADSQEVELALNSSKFQYSARSRKIVDDKGETTGILFLLHDITEKRQRDKFRSEFVDLLSHELKTPLQSLGTATELLVAQKSMFPADTQLILDTISEDIERIRAVAQEFMQVTQSHSKIMKLKLDRVAMNVVVPDWIKPFKIIARDRKVKLDFKLEGSEIIWANIDVVKFPWVISNLLSNAIRHSPSGTTVEVILTDRNGAVEIQIQDEGIGIPEADRDRIFEAFFQGTMASGGRGLFGVGLTIAREVVEAHDGRIEYFPRTPKGSEFRITLPFPSLYWNETSHG
jgi:NtrC-family two-component system sensor histidine kinase KinB